MDLIEAKALLAELPTDPLGESPKTVVVRVVRTYHRTVTAEFGDTPEVLIARGVVALAADTKAAPDGSTAVLLPPGAVI